LALEKKFALKSSLTLTVSEDEKLLLQTLAPKGNFETLWMSFETVEEWQPKNELLDTCLFVGNFRHTPNKVSLKWFIKEVHPLIIEKNQDIILNDVGTGLSPTEVEEITAKGVNLLGFVDDLTPLYLNAKVVVIPLQYGAGIKGKMCEALSHASTIVSTSYGAEGLSLKDGVDFLLADNASDFALQVSRVLADEQLQSDLSKAAFNYAKANLSSDAFKKKIKEIALNFD
jgi:glycosyltransferase involved in cell wall biosynthesis